jgi:hypothetical protein
MAQTDTVSAVVTTVGGVPADAVIAVGTVLLVVATAFLAIAAGGSCCWYVGNSRR